MEEKTNRFRIIILAVVLLAIVFMVPNLIPFSALGLPGFSTAEANRIELQDGRKFSAPETEFLLQKFDEQGIDAEAVKQGQIKINEKDRDACNAILRSDEFRGLRGGTKANNQGFLPRSFIAPSEQARIAKEEKLERLSSILKRMNGIEDAIVVYDQAKESNFKRNMIHSSAVTLWADDGSSIQPMHAAAAKQLVLHAFAGMKETDVEVIDGDSGRTFYASPQTIGNVSVQNQLDLESTRQYLIDRCGELLVEFGEADVKIELASKPVSVPESVDDSEAKPLTDRTTSTAIIKSPQPAQPKPAKIQVVTNGNGKIRVRNAFTPNRENKKSTSPPSRSSSPTPEKETQPDNQPQKKTSAAGHRNSSSITQNLLGIEVSLRHSTVADYLREKMDLPQEFSDQQFSRGITAVRNEITKKIVNWFQNNGMDIESDLVSVKVIAEVPGPTISEATAKPAIGVSPSTWALGFGLPLIMVLFVLIWKKSANARRRNNPEQYSAAGRSFVSRNLATTGSVLADEIHEVLQSDPGHSIRAFQDLVQGKAAA